MGADVGGAAPQAGSPIDVPSTCDRLAPDVVTQVEARIDGRRIGLQVQIGVRAHQDRIDEARAGRAVYLQLLGPAGLGTARFYGSVCQPGRSRYWLMLEHLPADRLHWRDADHFVAAGA